MVHMLSCVFVISTSKTVLRTFPLCHTEPNPVQNLTAVVYNSTAIEILWRQPDNQPDQVTYIVSCDDMIQHARRESCRVKGKSISFSHTDNYKKDGLSIIYFMGSQVEFSK